MNDTNAVAHELMAAAMRCTKQGRERIEDNSAKKAPAFPQLLGAALCATGALCFFAATNAYSVMLPNNKTTET